MNPLTTEAQPETLEEFVNQDHVTQNAEKWIRRGDIETHKLFYGEPGLGKTTLADILINELDLPSRDYLKINCSDGGQQIVDEAIRFLQTTPLGGTEDSFKILVMDEFHNLEPRFQKKLRIPVQEHEHRVRIIFIANSIAGIEDAMIDRATQFKFKRLEDEEIEKLAVQTAEKMGWRLTERDLDLIKHKSDGSPRQALKILQEEAKR